MLGLTVADSAGGGIALVDAQVVADGESEAWVDVMNPDACWVVGFVWLEVDWGSRVVVIEGTCACI